MNKKLRDALNDQINKEFYSAYLYLSMAAYCDSMLFSGFAHWLKVQFHEEWAHGMKLYDFLVGRGEKVILKAIDQPPIKFTSSLGLFEQVYRHEQKVTGMIKRLGVISDEVGDSEAAVFLRWFVKEQVEEEENATRIIAGFKSGKSGSESVAAMDRKLARRKGPG
ncbi:MAG: ferritin [Candidatus Omnitrophica bacterium]|nr:ferritin [Candidatus Omnitrophota bacterium]